MGVMLVKHYHKPPMTGNGFADRNGDDWGARVYHSAGMASEIGAGIIMATRVFHAGNGNGCHSIYYIANSHYIAFVIYHWMTIVYNRRPPS